MNPELEFFDYELIADQIAQVPAEPRDSARLLVAHEGGIDHRRVSELDQLLEPGDLLVVNDTKVRPARLNLRKETGGAAEVLLVEPDGDPTHWLAMVKPSKRLGPGTILYHEAMPVIEIGDVVDLGLRRVRVINHSVAVAQGRLPLPPYIAEAPATEDRYQTIYARRPGSIAAPTAGLHLTDALFTRLDRRGVAVTQIELEVGLGTFRPITTDSLDDHEMHSEAYRIEPDVWQQIQQAKRVVAVGTTVVRTLESAAVTGEMAAETDLFIRRGFEWKVVDVLLTNFHMPKSTLLVLVDAFIGPRWVQIYREALDAGYGVGSFGDAMLLTRSASGQS